MAEPRQARPWLSCRLTRRAAEPASLASRSSGCPAHLVAAPARIRRRFTLCVDGAPAVAPVTSRQRGEHALGLSARFLSGARKQASITPARRRPQLRHIAVHSGSRRACHDNQPPRSANCLARAGRVRPGASRVHELRPWLTSARRARPVSARELT